VWEDKLRIFLERKFRREGVWKGGVGRRVKGGRCGKES
jgi:hypothetical protein